MEHQLLVEDLNATTSGLIQESSTDGKNMWISGIFMQSEIKNRNGRVYPLQEMRNAVNMATSTITANRGIFGELDHPQTLTINSDRVSHAITELRLEGNDVIGKAKMLNTPMGLIAQELFRSGVAMGVSSRGAGNVNESGGVSAYQFITVDIVTQPSAQGAYPSAVYESLDRYRRGNQIQTLAEQLQHDKAAQKYFQREFRKWLAEGIFKKA